MIAQQQPDDSGEMLSLRNQRCEQRAELEDLHDMLSGKRISDHFSTTTSRTCYEFRQRMRKIGRHRPV